MGQCTSRKATGSLTTTSTFVSHVKPAKMEKSRNFKSITDEQRGENRVSPNESSQLLMGTKKPQSKHSKGVAMSFGFKRRATPMTTNNGPIRRDFEDSETPVHDPNGNKEDTSLCLAKNQTAKVRTTHKAAPSQKPSSITARPSRFGFHQTPTDRTNKVADIKTAPSPIEFGTAPQNSNRSRLTSPTTETDMTPNRRQPRAFTRNVSKTEAVERLTSPTTEEDYMSNYRRVRTFSRNVARTDNIERLTSPRAEQDTPLDKRTSPFTRYPTKTDNAPRQFSPTTTALTSPTTEQDVTNGARMRTFSRNKREATDKLTSPTTEQDVTDDRRTRTFTRNIGKTDNIDRPRAVIDNSEISASFRDRFGSAQIQMGKFTFQTTRLPQPEPIRVIETKTAKTIANNNKRFARIRRQFEKASIKAEEDSGFGSNTSGYLGESDPMPNLKHTSTALDDNRTLQSLGTNTINIMENSDSLSETGTPPPLPELPSVFRSNSPKSTRTEKECRYKEKHDGKRPFIKLGKQRTFLKSRQAECDSSPHSSSEHDWTNAGEAMAEDSSLLESPKHRRYESYDSTDIIQDHGVSTCATVVEAALQTLVKPSIPLELNQNLKTTQKMSLLDEDPSFTAVAANNKTGHLLDEEILSPVESLLSSSETEEILKKKMPLSSSNSKDVNEKLTPVSPDTPSNGTYSLSDDKEDFLIDDEIADQPELVFEDTINTVDSMIAFKYKPDKISEIIEDTIRDQRVKSFELEASPLPSRKRRDFLHSITGSIDSLSPCDSIASDDLMMEYDISQTNDNEGCDRRSGSFSSLDDTFRTRLKSDDGIFGNKNLFKSLSSKPSTVSRTEAPAYVKGSPQLLRRKFSHQSSPETRSPKNKPFSPFGYNSMAYDPTSDCLMLTKTNHSAIQQDIIGIKTMLLTLKRVLNESETRNSLNNNPQVCSYGGDNIQNNNNNSEFKVELADLRRQVIFLQGQLEDKEKAVDNLQQQIESLANQNTQIIVDTPLLELDIQNRCNAATQTDRIRPISSGSLTLSGSSMEDNGPLVRLLVK